MVDVYVGFTFLSAWIVYREKSLARAFPWMAAVLTLGNVVAALYAFLAAVGSGGDWQRFWLGARAKQ